MREKWEMPFSNWIFLKKLKLSISGLSCGPTRPFPFSFSSPLSPSSISLCNVQPLVQWGLASYLRPSSNHLVPSPLHGRLLSLLCSFSLLVHVAFLSHRDVHGAVWSISSGLPAVTCSTKKNSGGSKMSGSGLAEPKSRRWRRVNVRGRAAHSRRRFIVLQPYLRLNSVPECST